MKIDDAMIQRFADALDREDWLPPDWDSVHDGYCPTCGHVSNANGDGGEQVRQQLRAFLEAALRER